MTYTAKRFIRYNVLVLTLAGPIGCDGGTGETSPDAAADGNPGPVVDAAPGEFSTLVTRSWSIPPGNENYRCTRLTLTEDTYISGFRALAPIGTHHAVLAFNDTPVGPDGEYDCAPEELGHFLLYSAGIGTDDLRLPEGVAIKLRAGQQLNLSVHIYNATDTTLTGTSGTLARVLPVEAVEMEAESVYGGEYLLSILPDPENLQTVHGGCKFDQDATVVAMFPHMHKLARHIKVTHESAAGNVTLIDAPYDFNEQINWYPEPFQIAAGERLAIDCTYLNDTGNTVNFGPSVDDEMCLLGIYRYPATGAGLYDCVELDSLR